MKGTRILLAIVCAAALAAVPAAAQSDGWDNFGGYDAEAPAADPAVEPPKETGGWDDGIWENWDGRTADPALAEPSEKQQELEQKQQELKQKQQEREKAFAEAARENAEPAEEPKTPGSSGESGQEDTSPELVLPERETGQVSPMRYLLIGALLAAAICIAVYLFTHPVREEDAPSAQDKD